MSEVLPKSTAQYQRSVEYLKVLHFGECHVEVGHAHASQSDGGYMQSLGSERNGFHASFSFNQIKIPPEASMRWPVTQAACIREQSSDQHANVVGLAHAPQCRLGRDRSR